MPKAIGISSAMAFAASGLIAGVHGLVPPREEAPHVPESMAQREGDAQAGRDYVLHGDYIGSGIPLQLFRLVNGPGEGSATPGLERRGEARSLPLGVNAFKTPDGVDVVAGANCLACHASMFHGELVIGLGNSLADWTRTRAHPPRALNGLAAALFGTDSSEWRAFRRFMRGAEALEGQIDTPFRGVNPAFRIEEVAAAHRAPSDLSWSEKRLYEPLDGVIASDVPPWWNVRKKSTLYYNGMGRGDFARLIQQITVVAIEDAEDAARINESMPDVLAFLRTLEPPEYPGAIDRSLAARGEAVFARDCASCHGTYGEEETYPNKLVPVEIVGTDPAYAETLMRSPLPGWYNESWFAKTPPESRVVPTRAYVAPPLDGIWCTAPYLHNGSVPTLEALLDSSKRPTYWRRSFDDADYDLDSIGWRFQRLDAPAPSDLKVYDTTRRGYGNGGHTFGDDLSAEERRAVLEYLKTL